MRPIKFRAWNAEREWMTYDLGGDILGDVLTGKRSDLSLQLFTGL